MTNKPKFPLFITTIRALAGAVVAFVMFVTPTITAQDRQPQERVAEIKQAKSLNKEALAEYTRREQQTISIKGEVKKQELYQVQMGPDGKPQKSAMDPKDQSPGGRQHGLKYKVVEKKKEESADSAKEIASLGQSYAQPTPGSCSSSTNRGNVMLGTAGAPNEIRIVVQDYPQQGDSVTIVFNKGQQAIQSLQVSSYLDDPKDAVKISAQFAQLPNGPNHMSNVFVDGVSKQLTVAIPNSNYEKM